MYDYYLSVSNATNGNTVIFGLKSKFVRSKPRPMNNPRQLHCMPLAERVDKDSVAYLCDRSRYINLINQDNITLMKCNNNPSNKIQFLIMQASSQINKSGLN